MFQFNSFEKFLWVLLFSLVSFVFALAFYDPTIRPQVVTFANVALGAILTAMSANAMKK
jgi:hypothetical protein